MNYQQMMSIDESRLDAEWASQANKYMEFVEAEAEANRQVDLLKERVEVVEGEQADLIRKEYDVEGKKGITEKALAQILAQNAAVQAVKEQKRLATYQQDMVAGARKAMEHRKAALENLVIIAGRNNRADPSVPGTTRAQVAEVTSQKRMAAHEVKGPERPQAAKPKPVIKQEFADLPPGLPVAVDNEW